MRKLYQIKTESGSLYLVAVNGDGTLFINQEKAVKNPARWLNRDWDSWQPCTIKPWPVEVGKSFSMVRPLVPYGQGRLTSTSPVVEIVSAIETPEPTVPPVESQDAGD